MVFVDYEYWFYSYKNKYNLRPDTAAWRAELEKQFDIEDIMIFADFSSPGIGEELAKLRNITNTIIETGTATQYRKKDMTDFVMLDYIYQNVTSRNDVGTYIIFTGDGHFQSVVKYLVHHALDAIIVAPEGLPAQRDALELFRVLYAVEAHPHHLGIVHCTSSAAR